uniref:Uncharacterized protein n=1 Tax=Ditylenchus dipsaci TaxID=166011 RepID=A0A915EB54_9BILA
MDFLLSNISKSIDSLLDSLALHPDSENMDASDAKAVKKAVKGIGELATAAVNLVSDEPEKSPEKASSGTAEKQEKTPVKESETEKPQEQ